MGLLSVVIPTSVSAHLSGQPPFFLIDGKYTGFYPVYVTSLNNFILPQDSTPQNYLVNTPLHFELDANMLPFPDSVIAKTTFHWDFGDGTKTDGLKATHTYTKIGSFLLTINADYGGYSDPNTKPLLQAILINIVPTQAYKLPQAVITVDNKQINDPKNDIIQLADHQAVHLDATSSHPGSAPIVSYFWDVGDGTSKTTKAFTYDYTDDSQVYIFPMLRVKDKNGFINDTYFQLENHQTPKPSSFFVHIPPVLIAIILLNGAIVGFVIYYLFKKK